MIDFNTLQDAVNGYRYLETQNTENDYAFVLETIGRSMNVKAVSYVNQATEYSPFAVDMLRVFLYEFARDSVQQFVQQHTQRYPRLDYFTILVSVREITHDKNLKNNAINLLKHTENVNNEEDIKTNEILDICKEFVALS